MHFLSSEESSIVVAFTLHPSGSVKQTMGRILSGMWLSSMDTVAVFYQFQVNKTSPFVAEA